MKTLKDTLVPLGLYSRVTFLIGGAACFHGSNNAPPELWNLSDYSVSSVSGGSVWLNPKSA